MSILTSWFNRVRAQGRYGLHRLLCHPLTEIAHHAIPHPELHLGCWAVALGCRLVHRILGSKQSWLEHAEHLARVLGGDET